MALTPNPRFPYLPLAEDIQAKGFSLSGGPEHWTVWHLAEQVISLVDEVEELEATLLEERLD